MTIEKKSNDPKRVVEGIRLSVNTLLDARDSGVSERGEGRKQRRSLVE